jgi:hypothetical protein
MVSGRGGTHSVASEYQSERISINCSRRLQPAGMCNEKLLSMDKRRVQKKPQAEACDYALLRFVPPASCIMHRASFTAPAS